MNIGNASSVARELRTHIPATALATGALFVWAFGIPALFRAGDVEQTTRSSLPDAPVWLLVSFVVLLGPWLEEMIFRGWLINGARRLSLSFLSASLISTSLWILMHLPGTFQAGLIYAGSGLILCGLRYHTGRIWPCVLAHMAYNTLAALMLARP